MKIVTVHILVDDNASLAALFDGLNEGFREHFSDIAQDWAYDSSTPDFNVPTKEYEEGDFTAFVPGYKSFSWEDVF